MMLERETKTRQEIEEGDGNSRLLSSGMSHGAKIAPNALIRN